MKIAEIRNLNETELKTKARELREEGFNLRMQQQTGRLEKPSRLNDIRKDVAKIETVLSEQRLKKARA
jgi:large subunit ribosomal protein L29